VTDYTNLIARLRIVPLHSGFGSTCHAAADALEVQAKLIEKLKANAVFWQKDALHTLKVKNEGDARIAELEAALKPFADVANYFDNEPRYTDEDSPCEAFNTFGDLRAARAAYLGEKE